MNYEGGRSAEREAGEELRSFCRTCSLHHERCVNVIDSVRERICAQLVGSRVSECRTCSLHHERCVKVEDSVRAVGGVTGLRSAPDSN